MRLPFPPSINHYWRTFVPKGGKRAVTYLSAAGKQFRTDVFNECRKSDIGLRRFVEPFEGRLKVCIELTAPNRRKFDIDNRIKACLDALQETGLFVDDEQIDELIVKRLHVEPPGCCDVTITETGD